MKKLPVLLSVCLLFSACSALTACNDLSSSSSSTVQSSSADSSCSSSSSSSSSSSLVAHPCTHDYQLYSLCVDGENGPCGKFVCNLCDDVTHGEVTHQTVGMPILYVTGDISEMSKDNKVTVSLSYTSEENSFDCDATMKWQGASSLGFPKKNYNIQLLKTGTTSKNKVEIKEAWGKQSKYCIKANYIDFSQARNVVSGQLYSQIVHSRNLQDEVGALTNGGAVDGFPILIYINGSYQGLHTLNIAKDNWMWGMDDDEADDGVVTKQAALMADDYTSATALQTTIDGDFIDSGFELEYCSTEDTIGNDWVAPSFNDMIAFVNQNDGEDFKNGIRSYVCLERTIDTLIYTWMIAGADNGSKNVMWLTYDGTRWFPSMYDMDGTWGLHPAGSSYFAPGYLLADDRTLDPYIGNELCKKVYTNFKDEVIARYFELRNSVLSLSNVNNTFASFFVQVPNFVYQAEAKKWSSVPSKNTSTYEQIISFAKAHFEQYDEYFSAFIE